MSNKRLNMYIIGCHVDKPLEEADLQSKYNIRIQAGAALTDKRIYELNDHDDFEDSISDRNQRYSEMTAMYWIGKHIESDYVGIAHYRRRFLLSDAELDQYMNEGFDIITTKSYPLPEIVSDNYRICYYSSDWELFLDILNEFHPEDIALSEKVFAKDHIHPCNMNIFSAEAYKEYCDWIFPMLNAFYERSPWKTDTYQRRDVGFIGERLSSLFVEKYMAAGKRVIEAPFRDLKSATWTPTMECALTDFDGIYRACQKYYLQNNITRCRELISKALENGGFSHEKVREISQLFRAGVKEQHTYPLTFYEYLPDMWKKDLDTLLAAYNGVGTIMKIASGGVTLEVQALYKDFVATTGFTDVIFKHWCDRLKLDYAIYDLVAGRKPILILVPEDICYGSLQAIARHVGKCLELVGESVIYSSDSADFNNLLKQVGTSWKMIIGVHSLALNNSYFQGLTAVPKIQIVMDSTYFIPELFVCPDDMNVILCHDNNYVSYAKKYYGYKNVFKFAIGYQGEICENEDRTIDLSFVGTYKKPTIDHFINERDSKALYDFMLEHPAFSFEEGVKSFFKTEENGLNLPELIIKHKHALYAVSDYYRNKVIEQMLSAGIIMDVYGDSWNSYDGPGKDNLRIHEETDIDAGMEVMKNSKLSLNIMSWHKDGLTERIFNIMASGAVLLSDETTNLLNNFVPEGEGQEMILFNLKAIDELPAKVKALLNDDILLKRISKNAVAKMKSDFSNYKIGNNLLNIVESLY